LLKCLWSGEAVVRMRAADAAEKISPFNSRTPGARGRGYMIAKFVPRILLKLAQSICALSAP